MATLGQAKDLPTTIATIVEHGHEILNVTFEADTGTGADNFRWTPSQTEISVLLGKLERLEETPHPYDDIFVQAPLPNSAYKGVILRIKTNFGDLFGTIRLTNGRLIDAKNQTLAYDAGRKLEYWLYSTGENPKTRAVAAQVLPFFAYEQCINVGNLTVETTPKQCILPDGRLMLDVPEEPTTASLQAIDFESCKQFGKALINTFPRRCLAAGGRVFTEPAKLPALQHLIKKAEQNPALKKPSYITDQW